MAIADLLFIAAILAVVAGVALLVGAFLGVVAAVGASLLALSGALFFGAARFAAEDAP